MKLAWSFTRVFFGSTISLVAFGCAQGSSLDIGLGGAGGASDGSSRPTTNHTGQGPSTSGPTTSGPTTSGTPASSGALASSGNGNTTANATTAPSVVASSSSGGSTTCDPMNPTNGCTIDDHCLPTDTGVPACTPPVGTGTQYTGCVGREDCAGPFECVDLQDGLDFCCLGWCTSDVDCATGSCAFFDPGLYVGATQYGVCYDGGGGCFL